MPAEDLAVNDPRDSVILAKYGHRWRWYPNPPSRRSGHHDWACPPVSEWYWADSVEEARTAAEALSLAGTGPSWGGSGKARVRDRRGRIVAVAADSRDGGTDRLETISSRGPNFVSSTACTPGRGRALPRPRPTPPTSEQ